MSIIATITRLAPLVAAAALMPATTAVAESSGTSGPAIVDLVISDFADHMRVYYDNELVDQTSAFSRRQVEAGEWIHLGRMADENGGWSFLEYCPPGARWDGFTGTFEGSPHRFQAVAGEHYVFIGLCEAYLETIDGSFAVGKLPTDIGPPFDVEYEAELTSSEGWVQSNSVYGTLRGGEPLMTTASFEDRGVTGQITTTIDVLDFSIDADGNVVDATVDGTQETDWSTGGEPSVVPVTHAAGVLTDGTLLVTLHSYEGAPTLAEYVMQVDNSPGPPPGRGGGKDKTPPSPPELGAPR